MLGTIKRNEVSFNVVLLHQVLAVLGYSVSNEDVSKRRAGDSTQQQVKALLAQFSIREPRNVIIDSKVSKKLTDILTQSGFISPSTRFMVSGSVTGEDERKEQGVQLYAFDIDLKTAALIDSVTKINELTVSSGFEYLGTTTSDIEGNYYIPFYQWQYHRAEREKADVVVYAVEKNHIIGRSTLLKADSYDANKHAKNVDIHVERLILGTEYQRYYPRLQKFLDESEVLFSDLAQSVQQISFAADELDIPSEVVSVLAEAYVYSLNFNAQYHEIIYALMRRDIVLSELKPTFANEASYRSAISEAVQEKMIARQDPNQVTEFLSALKAHILTTHIQDPDASAQDAMLNVLTHTTLTNRQKQEFATALYDYQGVDASVFFEQELVKQPSFKNKPELIERYFTVSTLGDISLNNTKLLEEAKAQRLFNKKSDLVNLPDSQWLRLIKKSGVPDAVSGQNKSEKEKNYLASIKSKLNRKEANLSVIKLINNSSLSFSSDSSSAAIQKFLANSNGQGKNGFSLETSRISDFQDELKSQAGDGFDIVNRDLQKLRRMHQVSIQVDDIAVLDKNGLHSAQAVSHYSEKSFVNRYANQFGGASNAKLIHQRATAKSTSMQSTLLTMRDHSFDLLPGITGVDFLPENLILFLEQQGINFSTLFGTPNICECSECQSVYSPAAYYVDILRFLSKQVGNISDVSALDRLLERRPDLVHLKLNCENSHTLLPYIDLAIETMQAKVAFTNNEEHKKLNTGNLTTNQLRAEPQFVRSEATQRLNAIEGVEGKAVFPAALPYDRDLHSLREYLATFSLSRAEILKVSSVLVNGSEVIKHKNALAAETLGLSEQEYQILTSRDYTNQLYRKGVRAFYGNNNLRMLSQAGEIPTLLELLSIKYIDLVQVLETQFINPYRHLIVELQFLLSSEGYTASALYNQIDLHSEPSEIEGETLRNFNIAPAARNVVNLGPAIARGRFGAGVESVIDNFIARSNATNPQPPEAIKTWLEDNLEKFNEIITLYAPAATCDLELVSLTDMNSLVSDGVEPSLPANHSLWSKLHRFVRLQKKLVLDTKTLDRLLIVLSNGDINAECIIKLAQSQELAELLELPVGELTALWGDIEWQAEESLFSALFSKHGLPKDTDFLPNGAGQYFITDSGDSLEITYQQKSAFIAAAFEISESDFLELIRHTLVNMQDAYLNVSGLSHLYALVLVARALKVNVKQLLLGMETFGFNPFARDSSLLGSQVDPEQQIVFITMFKYWLNSKLTLEQWHLLLAPERFDQRRNASKLYSEKYEQFIIAWLEQCLALVKQVRNQLAGDSIDEQRSRSLSVQFESLFKDTATALLDFKLADINIFNEKLNEIAIAPLIEVVKTALIDRAPEIDIAVDLDDFEVLAAKSRELIGIYERLSLVTKAFGLSTQELQYFANTTQLSDLDLVDFSNDAFKILSDYSKVRDNTSSEASLTLIQLWIDAESEAPMEEQEVLIALSLMMDISLADLVAVNEQIRSSLALETLALDSLLHLVKITSQIKTLGVSANDYFILSNHNTESHKEQEEIVKHAVKANYNEENWLTVAGKVSDKIRVRHQEALVAYLLQMPDIKSSGVRDTNGLFEHLLIDVQMSSCMETSRIVQASAAVQMFVNRILLNLEKALPPSSIDRERWDWMKNYRVWEANRKVFLYPENWLEPEWRNDKSELFTELESHLTQNDITPKSTETALRNYVMGLDEVSNLEVVGMYKQELGSEGNPQNRKFILHVFGRTRNVPHKYFYRTRNKYEKWSAWETVSAGIQGVDDGENSGVHLVPVVWKGRLILFWPEFIKKTENTETSDSLRMTTTSGNGENGENQISIAINQPKTYWEIRLAWSEYVDKNWTNKKITKQHHKWEVFEGVSPKDILIVNQDLEINNQRRLKFLFFPSKLYRQKYKQIRMVNNPWSEITFIDLNAEPLFKYDPFNDRIWNVEDYLSPYMNSKYISKFSKRIRSSHLVFIYGQYLMNKVPHEVIQNSSLWPSPDHNLYDIYPHVSKNDFYAPIFYTSNEDTYYVEKIHVASEENVNSKFLQKRFHTFHHPKAKKYIELLQQEGISQLLLSNAQSQDDDGAHFDRKYRPNWDQSRVGPLPRDLGGRTYYRDNVCFDGLGTNSLYNWELFLHAPLYIATRLSKNGKYEEAVKWFHYIFDPTVDSDTPERYKATRAWKLLPFKNDGPAESLEKWFVDTIARNLDSDKEHSDIAAWRDNPFDPHLVASNRPIAYMKHVVLKYIENLVDWADSKFKQFTRENVYEALQLYVIAHHILGPKPQRVPKRGETKDETYATLKDKLDDFGNALVYLENVFPMSGPVSEPDSLGSTSVLGVGETLYFCIPSNDKLIRYWELVEDRLYKIRNCQDIDGTVRRLALFSPPIDPALLVNARSQGLSVDDALSNAARPLSAYRFSFLIQKANEYCNDLKSLGSAILSAIEKGDAEALSLLRSSQEITMQELITQTREKQEVEASVAVQSLLKSRESAKLRLETYTKRLGIDAYEVQDSPELSQVRRVADIPEDLNFAEIESRAESQQVLEDDSGVNLIYQEKRQIELAQKSIENIVKSNIAEQYSGYMGMIPQFEGKAQPMGVGAGTGFGGRQLSWAAGAVAKGFTLESQLASSGSTRSATLSSFIRREQDWALQAKSAVKEILQLDKQIVGARIRHQIAQRELANHKQQIENSKTVEEFLKNKFSNKELYQWMKEQLQLVYKQSYNLCYDLVAQAEAAYENELGVTPLFLQGSGYWDNNKNGLLAGEKLQLTLRQLEHSYLEENTRRYELTKSVSLSRLNPQALFEFIGNKVCAFTLPRWLFDLDFPNHGVRRIKSVRISIPAVTGPYTTLAAELTKENDDGSKQTIATSSGQNDAGLFELNFRDERLLPFEGLALEDSQWRLELPGATEQFDRYTISDVIVHISYTAKQQSYSDSSSAMPTSSSTTESGSGQFSVISINHQFPAEWLRLIEGAADSVDLVLDDSYLPYGINATELSEPILFTQSLDLELPEIFEFSGAFPNFTIRVIPGSEDSVRDVTNLYFFLGKTNE